MTASALVQARALQGASMSKRATFLVLLALSACSSLPPPRIDASPSPCAVSEASYECQVERYQNVNVD